MPILVTCSTGILPNEHYMKFLQHIDFVLAVTVPKCIDCFEGLLILGGYDVDPQLYGEDYCHAANTIDAPRDELDLALIKLFIAQKKPIWGICRGIQVINVALGGTLVQDLPDERRLDHGNGIMHTVNHAPYTLARELWGAMSVVNSFHHQAIDRLAPGLIAASVCEDGVIEAIEHETLPIFAVQWHPERDPLQPAFFGEIKQAVI